MLLGRPIHRFGRLRVRQVRRLTVAGFESSCDDSAVACISDDRTVVSNLLASQWELHDTYKGVMPFHAARAHEDNFVPLLEQFEQDIGDTKIDAVAAVVGPGLTQCLRVGASHAASMAKRRGLPFVPINHLEAHLLSARLAIPECQFPFLTVLMSGGHCMIVVAFGVNDYVTIGSTKDDSVGEAYDKVARLIGCDDVVNTQVHPGALLERVAAQGDPDMFPFTVPLQRDVSCNFSFSGLKSQCARRANKFSAPGTMLENFPEQAAGLAAGFQQTTVRHLALRVRRALCWTNLSSGRRIRPRNNVIKWRKEARRARRVIPEGRLDRPLTSVVLCGGVANNTVIRKAIEDVAAEIDLPVHTPPPGLCADNGAMVAWAAIENIQKNGLDRYSCVDEPDSVHVVPRWPLDQLGVRLEP